MEVGVLRMVLSGLCLLPFAIGQMKKIRREEWKYLLMVGVIGNGIPAILFPLAMKHVNSATTGILNATTPLFALIIGSMAFGFAFSRQRSVGIVLGLAGTLMLILLKDEQIDFVQNFQYSLLILLATLGYGISVNLMKKFLHRPPPLLVSAFALLSILIPYLIYMLLGTRIPTLLVEGATSTWQALGYIGILAAIGTAWALVVFNRLIQMTDPVFSASVTYFIPLVAIGWGLWDGELVTWREGLGMCVILAGVFLTNRVRSGKSTKISLNTSSKLPVTPVQEENEGQ